MPYLSGNSGHAAESCPEPNHHEMPPMRIRSSGQLRLLLTLRHSRDVAAARNQARIRAHPHTAVVVALWARIVPRGGSLSRRPLCDCVAPRKSDDRAGLDRTRLRDFRAGLSRPHLYLLEPDLGPLDRAARPAE